MAPLGMECSKAGGREASVGKLGKQTDGRDTTQFEIPDKKIQNVQTRASRRGLNTKIWYYFRRMWCPRSEACGFPGLASPKRALGSSRTTMCSPSSLVGPSHTGPGG